MADRKPPLKWSEWDVLRREWIGKNLEHLEPAEQIAERIKALHEERDAAYGLLGLIVAQDFELVRKKKKKGKR